MTLNNSILCVAGTTHIDKFLLMQSYPEEDDSGQQVLESYQSRGGNAGNNCSVLAQIFPNDDHDVIFLGAIAQDQYEFIRNDFDANGVQMSKYSPVRPGSQGPEPIVILSKAKGSRTVFFNAGNLNPLTLDEFILAITKKKENTNFSWIHFEGRHNVSEMLHYLQNSANMNSKISLEIESRNNIEIDSIIGLADVVFIGPDHMIRPKIGKDVSKDNGARNMIEAIELFKPKMKPKSILICPWGDQGASGVDRDGKFYFSPAVPPKEIIDTCGAGDTFAAIAIACLMKGFDLQKTLNLACLIAGFKIGLRGYKNLGREFYKNV